MYKLLAIALVLTAVQVQAQDPKANKKALDSVDRVIIRTIITPAEDAAGSPGPNWLALAQQIKASYSETQTDRALTRAMIYYYWNKDWAQFSTALVRYTDAYEDKGDAVLMNKNARMILDHSVNPADWKAALGWIQQALDKDSDNSGYKATRDALQVKINGR